MSSPKSPPPPPLTILIDTREPFAQAYSFEAFEPAPATIRRKLPEGDYSIAGLEALIAVERKTLDDLAGSITKDRFWAEMERARSGGYRRFLLLVEGSIADVQAHRYAGGVHPRSILGATFALHSGAGIPTIWAGDRQGAISWLFFFFSACWERREKLSALP